jgi:hypothetical protein
VSAGKNKSKEKRKCDFSTRGNRENRRAIRPIPVDAKYIRNALLDPAVERTPLFREKKKDIKSTS